MNPSKGRYRPRGTVGELVLMAKAPEWLRYHRPFQLPLAARDGLMDDYKDILRTGTYTGGEFATVLRIRMQEHTGYDHAIPMGQATHALMLLARWYKQQGFDRAQIPMFTWPSTYKAFAWAGFRIDWVDIDPETWLPAFPAWTYSDTLRVPVDNFGNVYGGIAGTNPFTIKMVDSAQSLGAEWPDRDPDRVVSLSGSKILTSAEGGFLLTQDREIAEWAEEQRYWYSRMNEFEAALGLRYLPFLGEIVRRKAAIADEWRNRLPGLRWQRIPFSTNNYIVAATFESVEGRDLFVKAHPNIEFRKYYSAAADETDSGGRFDAPGGTGYSLPVTDSVRARLLAFPSWPDMPLRRIREALA